MAEGILSLYSGNSWTILTSRKSKTKIHWILQTLGGCLSFSGAIIEILYKFQRNRSHFQSLHAIIGLIAIILLSVAILSGTAALFSISLKKYLKPLYSKTGHNILAMITYGLGASAIVIAYFTKNFCKTYDFGNLRIFIAIISTISIMLTLIGPLKTFYAQCRNTFKI